MLDAWATATMLSYREYDQVARGYGGVGLLVDDPNADLQQGTVYLYLCVCEGCGLLKIFFVVL